MPRNSALPRKTASSAKTAAAKKSATATKKRKTAALRDVKNDTISRSSFVPPHLTATSDPDVFLNEAGARVNRQGLLLQLLDSAALDAIKSPAELLKHVALDPKVPMMVRIDAAKAAAPYFDKKMPTVVEGGVQTTNIDVAALLKLPKEERLMMLEMLKKIGIDVGGPANAEG